MSALLSSFFKEEIKTRWCIWRKMLGNKEFCVLMASQKDRWKYSSKFPPGLFFK